MALGHFIMHVRKRAIDGGIVGAKGRQGSDEHAQAATIRGDHLPARLHSQFFSRSSKI